MKEVNLSCDTCGFTGMLLIDPAEYEWRDICACPMCGADPEANVESDEE